MFKQHSFLRKNCGGSTLQITYLAVPAKLLLEKLSLTFSLHFYSLSKLLPPLSLSLPLELRHDAETAATNRFISKSCSPQRSWRTINYLLFTLLQSTMPQWGIRWYSSRDGPERSHSNIPLFHAASLQLLTACIHVIPDFAVPNILSIGQHGTKTWHILQLTLQLTTHPG